MKKIIKVIGLSIIIMIVFRGFIYRTLVKYNEIGNRNEIKLTDENIINKIELNSPTQLIDFRSIVEIANEITISELKFTTRRTSNNPNELLSTGKANCIGYAAVFNSIANHLIRQNGLEGKIIAKHKIGKLELCGIDLHQIFNDPFFRNHDYNKVVDIESGEQIFVDPSVSDYLRINNVLSTEQHE